MVWEDKFGRWIEYNEIVIEDLSEPTLFRIAENMQSVGYSLEYWKAPKQKTGHLHIKDILFPEEELSYEELKKYKELILLKYTLYGIKPDMNLCQRHRIAKENEEHYKGYGIKTLIKTWNEGKINYCEQELYFKSKKLIAKKENRKVVLNGCGITAKIIANVSILDKARQYGFNPDGKGRTICLFHGGSNPTSLKIYDDEGKFYCFSCGIAGNIVDFVLECKRGGLIKNG
jgi:hypothetical protein